MIAAGLLFALALGSYIEPNVVESLKAAINRPLQVLYAELIGFVSPGPRYILYPILIKLKEYGISTGVIIALISGHVLIEPSTGFVESGLLGYKFPLKRFIASFIITYLSGLITLFVID